MGDVIEISVLGRGFGIDWICPPRSAPDLSYLSYKIEYQVLCRPPFSIFCLDREMAGIRLVIQDSELVPPRPPPAAGSALDMVSDDDRSVAADSWSVKSDYGSTMDDGQRHVDAAEVLSSCNFPNASDNSSDKVFLTENEANSSMPGLKSYWNDIYAEHLANFQKHGQAGQVWFGVEAMIAVCWIKNLCVALSYGHKQGIENSSMFQSGNPDMPFMFMTLELEMMALFEFLHHLKTRSHEYSPATVALLRK
ncbi:hypothetical protein HPP92_019471 [Vanilla planifolia]|nr:hypothetical protein HPP92_019471 [Vanilla planifolia]